MRWVGWQNSAGSWFASTESRPETSTIRHVISIFNLVSTLKLFLWTQNKLTKIIQSSLKHCSNKIGKEVSKLYATDRKLENEIITYVK